MHDIYWKQSWVFFIYEDIGLFWQKNGKNLQFFDEKFNFTQQFLVFVQNYMEDGWNHVKIHEIPEKMSHHSSL